MERIYGSHTANDGGKITVTAAVREDIEELLSLEARSINPETFAAITREEFLDSIENDLVLAARHGKKIAALCVLVRPRASERSLAPDVGAEYSATATFDGVIVAPEERGAGLQRLFLGIAEDMAREWGAWHLAATVSRHNAPSRENFRRMGFTELCEVPKYGSRRIIVVKDITD
jgi:GNAT superfamily N-acetyltransferase